MAHTEPRTGIVVIAHGSRVADANRDLFQLAERLSSDAFTGVFPAFLEIAEPTIRQAGDACVSAGAERVILVPYFLSAGRHAADDLESARRELAEKYPQCDVRLAEPLGPHPLLEEIVLQRIREANHSR